MTENATEWVKVGCCAVAAVAFVVAMVAIAEWMPRCKPGDPGIYVGGMLVGGCPGERR